MPDSHLYEGLFTSLRQVGENQASQNLAQYLGLEIRIYSSKFAWSVLVGT